MTDLYRFDTPALYAALDCRRAELGLSWTGVARQMNEMSAELINRLRAAGRPYHPVSPSTLTILATRPQTGCQHALGMLRWLGRTPESFLTGKPDADDPKYALPQVGPDQGLRWALKLLWATMDEQRRAEDLTWAQLARVLSCGPNQLSGLRNVRYAIWMDLAMRITQWTGRPAADFVYLSEW